MTTQTIFTPLNTPDEVKAKYNQLFPLTEGVDTEALDQDYLRRLEELDGTSQFVLMTNKDGDEEEVEITYKFNRENEEAIVAKLRGFQSLSLEGVEIMLIGTWVWIRGDTKPYKDILGKKGQKCRWHSKRKCWYWYPGKPKRRFGSRGSLEQLAVKYGAAHLTQEEATI